MTSPDSGGNGGGRIAGARQEMHGIARHGVQQGRKPRQPMRQRRPAVRSAAAETTMTSLGGGGLTGARRRKINAWHRPPQRAMRTTTSSTKATTRATVAALKTTMMSSLTQNGNGENMASLGGSGAATVPEGQACGHKKAYKN